MAFFRAYLDTILKALFLCSLGSSRHKASSATQELDDLMQSLNTFKLKDQKEEPVSTNLDDMLGNLQENMEKQGVKTTQKGVCAACNKPIVGQVVTALGKTFHPEHFTCDHCNMVRFNSGLHDRLGSWALVNLQNFTNMLW